MPVWTSECRRVSDFDSLLENAPLALQIILTHPYMKRFPIRPYIRPPSSTRLLRDRGPFPNCFFFFNPPSYTLSYMLSFR